jgi:type I restriction enzyme S subunit
MPTETKIAACGELRNGLNYSQRDEGSGLAILKVKDFKEHTLVPMSGLDELDIARVQMPKDLLLSEGDTVIIRSNGNGDLVGRCLFVRELIRPTAFSGFSIRFRPNREAIEPRFAFYVLKSPATRERLVAHGSGTGIQSLNQETIGGATFVLPSRDEQRAIARVLGALDDKIELNRRLTRTLEELAAALFRSWFVDFDPVVAKAAGRQPAHLRSELAALFPATFQDSPLGPIPDGWRVGKVDELASLTRGGINPGAFPLETFDHYSIPAFDDGRFPRQELGGTIKSNKFPVPSGCVMVSKLNPDTPRIWLPDVTGERRAVCSTEFLVSTPKPPATREFLFGLFSSEAFTSSFATLVTGTSNSHQRVKPDNLLTTEIVIPDERLISAFTKLAQPWLAQVTHNIRESRTLAALRDTLLPKLLSGELRVKPAEKLVEAKT